MWAYPWDVQDLGFETAESELRGLAGLNTVSLATSYHAGRFLQPRSPRRKAYFPEDGTIYFEPTPALWEKSRIKPKLADVVREGGDVLRELVRRRDAGGLKVSCWTVCLHNTRLGMLHPEAVTAKRLRGSQLLQSLPLEPRRSGLRVHDGRGCHARLQARRDRARKPLLHGLRARIPSRKGRGSGSAPKTTFCCRFASAHPVLARAAATGVDGEAARATIRRWIMEACERAVPEPRWPDYPARGLDTFRHHPEVHSYLLWRFEPVTSLVAEIRERADPATRVYAIDLKDGWREGCDTAALAKASDGIILCAYGMSPAATAALIRHGRAAVGPDKFLGTGFRVFYPEVSGPQDLVATTRAAIEAGAEGVNFYNWGLIPAPRLDWVRAAADVARTGGRG